jgi:hypothetical protein
MKKGFVPCEFKKEKKKKSTETVAPNDACAGASSRNRIRYHCLLVADNPVTFSHLTLTQADGQIRTGLRSSFPMEQVGGTVAGAVGTGASGSWFIELWVGGGGSGGGLHPLGVSPVATQKDRE